MLKQNNTLQLEKKKSFSIIEFFTKVVPERFSSTKSQILSDFKIKVLPYCKAMQLKTLTRNPIYVQKNYVSKKLLI